MSVLSNFFKKGKTITFKKNDLFISPKKEPEGIYQLTSGFIVSYNLSTSHKRRIQTILKKDETFPLAWAINNTRNNIYVEALTDGTAQMVDKKTFFEFITKNHNATLEMVSILLMYLSVYVERVDNLEDPNIHEKLIKRLLFFAYRFGRKEGNAMLVDVPLTHKLIAELISVSRENITRELKSLQKKKLITFKNQQLTIVNLEKLQQELIE